MLMTSPGAAANAAAIDHFYAWGARPEDQPCPDTPRRILCPCCQGSGEHPCGRGPELEDYPCMTCQGEGELAVSRLPLTRAGPDPEKFQSLALTPAAVPSLRPAA